MSLFPITLILAGNVFLVLFFKLLIFFSIENMNVCMPKKKKQNLQIYVIANYAGFFNQQKWYSQEPFLLLYQIVKKFVHPLLY